MKRKISGPYYLPLTKRQKTSSLHFATALASRGGQLNFEGASNGNPFCSKLHDAVVKKDEPLINKLLQRSSQQVNKRDKKGLTPLHYAVVQGQIKIVKLLLMYGADPALKEVKGLNALHLAAANGDIASLTLFLDLVTDKSMRDEEGLTPLHWAAAEEQIPVITLLLTKGADLFKKTAHGLTALDLVIFLNKKSEVREYLRKEMDSAIRFRR